jgi:hypothetical protein
LFLLEKWVRHLEDGTRQYIEGATHPEYIVTADDVDKLIAVECIPMDDQGRQVKYRDFSGIYSFNESVVSKDVLLIMQGELVRLFANDQNKIRCGNVFNGT